MAISRELRAPRLERNDLGFSPAWAHYRRRETGRTVAHMIFLAAGEDFHQFGNRVSWAISPTL